MSEVIIYGIEASTYVRTARMACEEKGVAYELDSGGFTGPESLKSPEHLALHPFGKVPALRHGDALLYETSAIIRYIDEAFDGPVLQPIKPLGRAHMEQWISAANGYFYPNMIRRYVIPYVFPSGPDGKPDQAAIEAAKPDIRRDLGLIDAALAHSGFLVDDRLTLADLMVAPILSALARAPGGLELLQPHGNILRAAEAMRARPSYVATMPPAEREARAAE